MRQATDPTPVVPHLQQASPAQASDQASPPDGPLAPNPLDWKTRNAQDGTNQLLRTGVLTMAFGALAATLTSTVFGGISPQGPHTNAGWLSLIAALMSLPFGVLAFALGFAKSLRNRHLARLAARASFRGNGPRR
jgi:hypothetical protein